MEHMDIESYFKRTGALTRSKLREYIPVMIMTNLSVFLLTTVDGVVAGNLVGADALASINIFYPAMITITVISALVDSGAGTSLSTSMGRNDIEGIRHAKRAVRVVMIVAALVTAVVQFPIIHILINSYHLTPAVKEMVWQYATGVMIAMPLGVISSVGSYQLQMIGKMRVLMILSIAEGVVNLALDLFLAGVMGMGVVGIGFGTAGANVVRCAITVIYLAKKTDMYNCGGVRLRWQEVKDVILCGCPDAASMLMLAAQNYFIMKIILISFGDAGGMIKGVCFFAFSAVNVIILGVQKSMRPMAGLFAGAGDSEAIRTLLRQCMFICTVLVCIVTAAVEIMPGVVYHINGVHSIPEGGIMSLRIFALHFALKGLNNLYRPYFANRKDSMAATGLTIVGNATLPFFALALIWFLPAPYLWLSYLLTELLLLILSQLRYRWWLKKDEKENDADTKVLHLTVEPEKAIEASRMIRRYADEIGASERVAYRMSLCMEEMVAYAVESQKNGDLQIQIMTIFGHDEGSFFMLDNGRCIELDENKELQELIVDNYGLLKKLAKSVEYQYILNLNYTAFRF